jgi:dihydropteroate synthase
MQKKNHKIFEKAQSEPFLVMGILNITPDSFSDGGKFLQSSQAIARCEAMIEAQVDIIDLGAESTRPGALEVETKEEWQRLKPVLQHLQKTSAPVFISVDTRKPEIMIRALDMGIHMINHVCSSSLTCENISKIATYDASYIGMHIHSTPKFMQNNPLRGSQAVKAVDTFFANTYKKLQENGLRDTQIWLDPGIGFGKDDKANLTLLGKVQEFSKKYNLALGISRKSFLTRILKAETQEEKDLSSKALESSTIVSGAKIIRTHQIEPLLKIKKILS